MPSITELSAAVTARNTGLRGVPEILKRIKGIVFTPKRKIILTAALATPSTTIRGLFLADTPSTRCYPVGPISEVTDGTTETLKISWAYGVEVSIAYGTPILTLHPSTVDERVLDSMQQFNGQSALYDAFLVDESDKWIGFNDSTGLQAFTVSDIFSDARKFHTQDGAKPSIRIVFGSPEQMNNGNWASWSTGYDAINDEYRMDTVAISQVTAVNASRIVDVKLALGATNLATTADAAAFEQTGAWDVQTDTGTALTVSTVTQETVGGVKCYRLTIGATSYPTSGDDLTIGLQLPSVLDGLATPIYGYEHADTLTQTAA